MKALHVCHRDAKLAPCGVAVGPITQPNDCPPGYYCPAGTGISSSFPCPPGTYNPVLALVDSLTAPIVRPIRRVVPPLGGLDLSPMVAILFLYLSLMLIVQPIKDIGRILAA